jgi:hypothetical protein
MKSSAPDADDTQYVDDEECEEIPQLHEDDINEGESQVPSPLPTTPSSSVASGISLQGSRKRRNNDGIAHLLKKNKGKCQKLIYIISGREHREDEIDLFYKSIAFSVKHLPRHLIADVKLQHLKTVTEMELRVYHEQQQQQEFEQPTREGKSSYTHQQTSDMDPSHPQHPETGQYYQ